MWSTCYYFQILMKLEFLERFSKNSQISNFIKNPSIGSRVVPCGRTNMTKLIVAFRNFANAPENVTALDRLFGLWTYCTDLADRVRFDLCISLSRPLVSHSACHSLHPTAQRGSVVCGVFFPCRCFKCTPIFTATPPVFLRGMVHLDKAEVVPATAGRDFPHPSSQPLESTIRTGSLSRL